MSSFSPTFIEPEVASPRSDVSFRNPQRQSSYASGFSDQSPRGVQQDDDLWKEYLEVATTVDARLVDDWTAIIDVILVYVALFSGVLTAFIIETSTEFERDPIAINNDLLVAIYKRSVNPSLPEIDTDALFRLDPAQRSKAVYRNALLYASLSVTIVVSALATACKLWVIRYNRTVNAAGSPFERAMVRQRAYSGMRAWKLEAIVEALPLLSLIAVFMFGLFIYSSILDHQGNLGFVVGVVTLFGLTFILVRSFSSAFIPAAPFQSAFSDFIRFLFRIFPERPTILIGKRHSVRVRTLGILLTSLMCFVLAAFLVIKFTSVFISIAFFPIAGVFALMRPGREKDMKPRVFEMPHLVSVSTIIIFTVLALATYFAPRTGLFIVFFCLAAALLYLQGYLGIKMSESVPKTMEAEAVAWMITSSAAQDTLWYQKAADIAGASPYLRALLLKRLLPLLTPLITSSHGDSRTGIVTADQEVYVDCLAKLADFRHSKGNILRNEAPVRHDPISTPLLTKLEKLTRARCPDMTASDSKGIPGGCEHGDAACPYRRVRASATLILKRFREDKDDDDSSQTQEVDERLTSKEVA